MNFTAIKAWFVTTFQKLWSHEVQMHSKRLATVVIGVGVLLYIYGGINGATVLARKVIQLFVGGYCGELFLFIWYHGQLKDMALSDDKFHSILLFRGIIVGAFALGCALAL
jgi:hypothetical protein